MIIKKKNFQSQYTLLTNNIQKTINLNPDENVEEIINKIFVMIITYPKKFKLY